MQRLAVGEVDIYSVEQGVANKMKEKEAFKIISLIFDLLVVIGLIILFIKQPFLAIGSLVIIFALISYDLEKRSEECKN